MTGRHASQAGGRRRPGMAELTVNQQMGRRNRNKGTAWMRDCIKALRASGWPAAEIVPSAHRSDIAGVGDVAIECKDTTRWDDVLQFIGQAQYDAAQRGGGLLPVVWKKTRGEGDPMRGLIIMAASDFWTDQDGFAITTYAGRLPQPGGRSSLRKHVQITGDNDQGRAWITFDMKQWAELRRAVEALGDSCQRPEDEGSTS
jgi:hypothetical protein